MKLMGTTAAPTADLTAALPERRPHARGASVSAHWSSGPHGGGTTRRRASDAVRVGIAAVLLVICIPLVQANTSVEIHVTELLTPPPRASNG